MTPQPRAFGRKRCCASWASRSRLTTAQQSWCRAAAPN